MKRTIFAMAFLCVLVGCSYAQTGTWRTSDHLTFGTKGDAGIKRIAPGIMGVTTGGDAATDIGALQSKYLITSDYTVATLPAAPTIGSLFTVTDSSSACTTGGGSTKLLCRWNGSSYDSYGGGGGGSGTVTVKSSGALTDTAFVTGNGTTVTQTACATCTLSAGGNAVFAGTMTATGGVIVPQAGGVGNQFNLTEGTAPATDPAGNTFGGTGFDGCYADSTLHGVKCKYNGGTAFGLNRVVASGTSAMGTSAISSGTCATVVTTSATGTLTTDRLIANPNADPTGVTGYAVSATGSLYVVAYPSADNINFKVCNNTSGSLTPSALTFNWMVVRP